MADTSTFISFRHEAQKAMVEAKKVVARVDREFKSHFGRGYGLMEKVRCADAEVVLLTIGTAASTAREVIDQYRRQGKKVGLCRLRLFRPFPAEELIKRLSGVKKVAVLDRNNSLGAGGIVAQELKAALFGAPRKPKVYEFIAGLGGKDITPETIHEAMEYTLNNANSKGVPIWMGVPE
jgi:pyruvate/2-oxoacid:ferredoxin oxidoreductase alpha subunit